MKQFSTILNVVLLLAVAFLYYLHFSGTTKDKRKSGTTQAGTTKDSCGYKRPVVAYIEQDSLNNNVTFIKEMRKELEAEQKAIVSEYDKSYRDLEAQRNEFVQKKGDKASKEDIESFQQHLVQSQQQIESIKQERGQKLAEKNARIIEDLQKRVKLFLDEYNKDEKYTYILATGSGMDYLFYKDSSLNITNEIIEGLNSKMKEGAK